MLRSQTISVISEIYPHLIYERWLTTSSIFLPGGRGKDNGRTQKSYTHLNGRNLVTCAHTKYGAGVVTKGRGWNGYLGSHLQALAHCHFPELAPPPMSLLLPSLGLWASLSIVIQGQEVLLICDSAHLRLQSSKLHSLRGLRVCTSRSAVRQPCPPSGVTG